MRDLLRTNDLVLISAVSALLDSADIGHMVADAHVSAIEGFIGVMPRRILVLDEDEDEARRLLTDAGLADTLYADG